MIYTFLKLTLEVSSRPFVYLGRGLVAVVRYVVQSPQAIHQQAQQWQDDDHKRMLHQWRAYGTPETKAAATKILREQYGE